MKISYELDLQNFEAWSGAKETLQTIIDNGLTEDVERLLEEIYPEGMDETQLNDLLWFEDEWIFDSIGFNPEEEEEEEESEE